jgi:hypothetical protein
VAALNNYVTAFARTITETTSNLEKPIWTMALDYVELYLRILLIENSTETGRIFLLHLLGKLLQ